MCKQQVFSAAKISLAEKAVKMPLFAAFRFAYVNWATTKLLESGNVVDGETTHLVACGIVFVSFKDKSCFALAKDGEMLLTYLVCPILPHSCKPSIWISAKNENEAIACYKKQVETFATLHAILPF